MKRETSILAGENRFAALMGDLVDSRQTESPKWLHENFNDVIDAANKMNDKVASPLTVTLGDEFQGLCPSLGAGFHLLSFIRINLLRRGIKCRFSLGLVELGTPLNTGKAWNMMGAGLAQTREKIGDKRSSNAYRFYIPEDHMTETLLEGIGHALSVVEEDWTKRQLEIVSETMQSHLSVSALASKLDSSSRTLYKILNAAQFGYYQRQKAAIEAALGELDRRFFTR